MNANAGGWVNPYRFDGRGRALAEPATGLDWLATRAYDPSTGRFLARDPLGRAPLFFADNPYAYAGNNPVSNVDPSGQYRAAGHGSAVRESGAATNHMMARVVAQHGTPSKGSGGSGDRNHNSSSYVAAVITPSVSWGDVLGETVRGFIEAAAAGALMALACSGAALFCEPAIDATMPILLAGVRHLLLAAADIADLSGAGLGSILQVQLRGFIVGIDMMQAVLILVNLLTLGDVGVSTFARFADAAAGTLQDEAELARLGFAFSESEETPSLAKLGSEVKAMSGSVGRLISVGGDITALVENSFFGTFIGDTQSFLTAWDAAANG